MRVTRKYLGIGLILTLLFSLSSCVVSSESETSSEQGTDQISANDAEFVGSVTGYAKSPEGFGGDDQTTVYVDNKKVNLDLIWPYSAGCMDREVIQDKAFKSAQDALERVLPIGTKVLVIRSGYEDGKLIGDPTDGFLHKLLDGSDEPTIAPPAKSVNEELVLTGFWVPLEKGFEFDAFTYGATYGKFEPEYLTLKQEEYAPLILAAGNLARTNQVGAMPICATMALDYRIDFFYKQVAAFRNDEEKNRLWWIERNKARNCRDGDGDGICYER